MADPVPLFSDRVYSKGGVPYAATDIEASSQNTFSLAPDDVKVFIRPRAYSQPSFKCSVFNIGPGAVCVRWDGQDSFYGDPGAILLPAGTGYAEAVTSRIGFTADPTGTMISMTCEPYFG